MAIVEITSQKFDENELQRVIERYNIDITTPEWQQAAIQIAGIFAQKQPDKLAKNIDKFKITDQKALEEIVELIIQNCSYALPRTIQNFRIMDEKILIKLAKLNAKQGADTVADNIHNFQITDKVALEEIAEIIDFFGNYTFSKN